MSYLASGKQEARMILRSEGLLKDINSMEESKKCDIFNDMNIIKA